ncbi:MAG TPA: hypothetical protein VEC38_05705 [Candidatus Binataceae bacterium]|nr:hypothetical protein [Candidatus Binataceae bacterium]
MGILTAETIKMLARGLYDYELTGEDARALADGAGPLLTMSSRLGDVLDIKAVEPPFSYANLEAEARRIRRIKKA